MAYGRYIRLSCWRKSHYSHFLLVFAPQFRNFVFWRVWLSKSSYQPLHLLPYRSVWILHHPAGDRTNQLFCRPEFRFSRPFSSEDCISRSHTHNLSQDPLRNTPLFSGAIFRKNPHPQDCMFPAAVHTGPRLHLLHNPRNLPDCRTNYESWVC